MCICTCVHTHILTVVTSWFLPALVADSLRCRGPSVFCPWSLPPVKPPSRCGTQLRRLGEILTNSLGDTLPPHTPCWDDPRDPEGPPTPLDHLRGLRTTCSTCPRRRPEPDATGWSGPPLLSDAVRTVLADSYLLRARPSSIYWLLYPLSNLVMIPILQTRETEAQRSEVTSPR